jgi:hypothetical protein
MPSFHISGTSSSNHQGGSKMNCVGPAYANSQSIVPRTWSLSSIRTLDGLKSSDQRRKEPEPSGAGNLARACLEQADQLSLETPNFDSRPYLANLRNSWQAIYLVLQSSSDDTISLCLKSRVAICISANATYQSSALWYVVPSDGKIDVGILES